jgi:hypothetical protein
MTRPTLVLHPLALALVVASAAAFGAGCDDKKPAADPTPAEGGVKADKYATADPKLENALQSAASAAPADPNGPPPTGVFAPGVADKRHPRGMPAKVDTVTDGSEPRVALDAGTTADAVRATSYGQAALELGMLMPPRAALPTIDLGLSLGPAKKDDGGADWLVADFKKATPAKQQYGELPPGTDKVIASLEGSQARVKLAADGTTGDIQTTLGKGTRPDQDRVAHSVAETLAFLSVPWPSKPVGVGAQWIAESRMPLSGIDVIAYRAYRVKSIDGNRLHLTLSVKAYAAGPDTPVQGLPKGATLEQVDVSAEGEMELVRGELLARKADVTQRVIFVFAVPGAAAPADQPGMPPGAQQGQTMTAQMQSQATFVRGDDLRAALHQ